MKPCKKIPKEGFTTEDAIACNWIGIEVRGVYDGVLFWYSHLNNTAYPRKGLEDAFKKYFKKTTKRRKKK